MTPEQTFVFYTSVDDLKLDDAFDGVVPPSVSNVDQLMDAVATALKFPAYFGETWNALLDCLRDLDWIEQRKVCLIHTTIPEINIGALSIYLDILRDAADHWKDKEAHQLIVAFPSSSEAQVRRLLR
jgi:hypothetical protein